jgi:putative membrane protein
MSGLGGLGWGWVGLGAVHMLLFWGFLILGIVVLVRFIAGGGDTPPQLPRTALEILKERYARGEIGKDEFEEKKRDLES